MHIITKTDYDTMLFKLKVIASTDIKVSRQFPYNHGLCGLKRELYDSDYRDTVNRICPLDLREKPSIYGCQAGCAIASRLSDQKIKQIIKDFAIKD